VSDLVLDSSQRLVWYLEDEEDPYADVVLGALSDKEALVPRLWP
jgi:hypothetical protein